MAQQKINNDEQIGFHKGALATLAKEREEMLKILSIVEQLMKMHLKSLKDLGIEISSQQHSNQQTHQKLDEKLKR